MAVLVGGTVSQVMFYSSHLHLSRLFLPVLQPGDAAIFFQQTGHGAFKDGDTGGGRSQKKEDIGAVGKCPLTWDMGLNQLVVDR